MSLLGNNIDPEKIIGMKPEDLKAKLDSTVSKADLEAATTSFKTGLDEIKAALGALRTNTTPPPEPIVEDPTDPTTALLTDPDKFVDSRMKPVRDAALETQAQVMEMRARQSRQFRGVFDQYGDELVSTAFKHPVQQRANANFWDWHIQTFLGNKVIKGELKPASFPSLIGSSSVAPGVSGPDGDPNKGFDPDVAKWLRDRNIPLDRAAKIHKIMGVNGDPISLANYKGTPDA